MTTHSKSQRGMSLVEVTIILLVLMLLTSVLAPSIFDFVVDAKMVKVKEDCEAIGVSVARLVRDVGPCLKFNGSDDCTPTNHVQVLYSAGANAGWPAGAGYSDLMESHLANNQAGYPLPFWRGAYLPPNIGSDPWGSAYAVNVGALAPGADEDCFIDTFCISAGPNRRFETDLAGNGTGGVTRGGDDFTYIIGGATCTTDNPPCTGPGCEPPCTGPGCEPPCTGPGCEPPCTGAGCSGTGTGHTIGYWKNHPEAMPTTMSIAIGPYNVTTTQQALAILGQKTYGSSSNGITKLYAQMLAAQLNISSGASAASIAATITAANSFLTQLPSSDWGNLSTNWGNLSAAQQAQVLAWKSVFDEYNNSLDR